MSAAVSLPDMQEPSAAPRPHVIQSNQIELYALTALLMFAPLAFGTVEPWAIFVLQLASAILFSVWTLQQVRAERISIRWNPLFLPMCAFAVLTVVQLVPGISAYRHATASTLLLYLSYGVICFLLTQLLERTTHLRQLATAFVVYGTGMAMFAVLQSLSSPGKLYWIRTPRFGGWIYGPYVNHNHYAGLMEMLTPIPLVFAFSRYAHGRKKWLAASAAAFMGASIFLSGSRGGMAAFAIQMAIFFCFLFRERTHNRVALLMGGFLLVALASIVWIGGSEVSSRLSTLADYKRPDLNTDIRMKIDRDAVRMFSARPVLGWGLGTFADVYPQFRSFYTNSLVNEAHNDYLQTLVETGILGFGVAMWLVVTAVRRAWQKTSNWPSDVNGILALAALLGISGILVHSLVDFNLEVPANAMLFSVLCTAAAMDARFRNLRREYKRREDSTEEADTAPVFHSS
jgi:O-antigen ligase